MLKTNLGTSDRITRLVLAAIIGGAGFYFTSWLGLIAIIPLVTAFVRWCPLYAPLGLSTCSKEHCDVSA